MLLCQRKKQKKISQQFDLCEQQEIVRQSGADGKMEHGQTDDGQPFKQLFTVSVIV